MSDSFRELAQVITEHAQPGRIDIVRAKQHLFSQLGDGQPHPAEALIASAASLLGAGPLGHPQIDLPGRDSVKDVVTPGHPVADGMLIAAGTAPLPGTAALTLTYKVPGYSAGVRIQVHRPGTLSDVVRLPHRLRQQGLWGVEADIFITDLASLGLDPRTERSLRGAIESYRRGVYLAAASLLGAAVEGAWYAAAQRLRPTVPAVNQLADSDRTAQLQAVTDALSTSLPGNRKWEATRSAHSPGSCATSATTAFTPAAGRWRHRDLLRRRQVWAAVPRSTPPPEAPGRDHRPGCGASLNPPTTLAQPAW